MHNTTLTTQAYVRALLKGAAPDPTAKPIDAALWAVAINALHIAYERDGTPGVQNDYILACQGIPGFAQMMEREPQEFSSWASQWISGEDLLRKPEPTKFAVHGIIAKPSLTTVFGGAGAKKSILLADMSVCIAHGLPWLPEPQFSTRALPTSRVKPGTGIKVTETPVLWIDIDGGRNRTLARMYALLRARAITEPHNLYVVSLPSPLPHADCEGGLTDLAMEIERLRAGVVIIDCLSNILGPDIDENSHAMSKVLGNLRKLSDATDCTIIPIHHSGHEGTRERGHSSIKASVDLSIQVKSEPKSERVDLKSGKVRDAYFGDLSALWTFAHEEGSTDLSMARFWKAPAKKRAPKEDHSPASKFIHLVRDNPGLPKLSLKDLADKAGIQYAKNTPGSVPSFYRFIDGLEGKLLFFEPGNENTIRVWPLDDTDSDNDQPL